MTAAEADHDDRARRGRDRCTGSGGDRDGSAAYGDAPVARSLGVWVLDAEDHGWHQGRRRPERLLRESSEAMTQCAVAGSFGLTGEAGLDVTGEPLAKILN
jgi:hypothetical protein